MKYNFEPLDDYHYFGVNAFTWMINENMMKIIEHFNKINETEMFWLYKIKQKNQVYDIKYYMPVLDKKLIEPVGSFRTETWEGLY
jgi:hypothetical protein